MKTTLVLLFVSLLAGCAGRGLEPDNTGPLDFAITGDFATSTFPDFSTSDLPVGGCTLIASWSSDLSVIAFNEDPSSSPGYLWDEYVEGNRSGNYPDGGSDFLYYELFVPQGMSGPVMVPHSLDFTNINEVLGLVLDYPPDDSTDGTGFIATSGDVTVTAADDTQPSGTVSVQGTNVVLQETDENDDILPNGACIQVGSFDLSAMYDNPPQ